MPWNGTSVIGSSGALELEEVPKSLAIIGAGVIGLELGSVWSRLGSKVEIFEAENNLLPMLDRDVVKVALKENLRIKILISTQVVL